MTLWIILTVMVALAVLGVAIPLVRRYEAAADSRSATLAVLKDQLGEIDGQEKAGTASPAEAEALRKLHPPTEVEPDIELGGWVMQRRCPHRNADLTVFGEVEGCELICTLHGWRWDLESGRCLTARDHPLRVSRPSADRGSI